MANELFLSLLTIMTKKKLLFLLSLISISFSAQIYRPIDTADYIQRKEFIKNFSSGNEMLVRNIKSKYPGKTGSELEKIYSEFEKDFIKQVKNKDFIFASVFDSKVKSLIERLRKNNPEIPKNLNILIAKDNTPNAYCLADGTFVINMGLFYWLDNDDQIASVISHELGHKMEEHSLKAFLSYINQNQKDRITVKSLKAVKENQKQNAFEILKSRVYKKSIEKRNDEIQADSLGYAVFRKSDFSKSEFVNALKKLQQFDTISPRQLKAETYKKYFTLPQQEFKEKWLNKEDFSLYNYNHFKEKLDKDSISSHPEVALRIEKLKTTFPELASSSVSPEASESFKNLEKTARMESMPNLYHSEDYGLGIYASLQSLQDGEEEIYHKMWLGKYFSKIYEARKNYNLNRYLDRVDPKNQSESYQQFLNFMWNLSLDEIKNIADYYQKKS